MSTFTKTELGFRTLKLRDLALNARQRRLLVLIDTEDFYALSTNMQQRIASPDLLQQLQDLGLITAHNTVQNFEENHLPIDQDISDSASESENIHPIDLSHQSNAPITETVIENQNNEIEAAHSIHSEILSFEDLKQFMMHHLQQYCGLMAKQLLIKIQHAEQISQLKQCQIQWITLLQESRILPQTLNHALQQVNLNMHQLQNS
ncbi:hypothetical protein [Acinetobacter sp. ANC 3813]|uniref:hypothetical protein n=1 Tax=Acinetobacter sp. ANC 3813 TaxID=1977873 RepID=UPI000A35134B|nr:hypothetical protein [Acinetobacter sp. ANC 3813]OTG91913.1 hypothetical protein B9T34_00760 [Acinetobacter sp. ANC 3813]